MLPLKATLRSLAKSPGFTLVALLTLALGIGVTSSMFSVIDALLFRSAPFPEPDRLVQVIAATRRGEMRQYSAIELQEIRDHLGAFEAVTMISRTQFSVSRPGEPPERISGTYVSEDVFKTFRVQPVRGRAFTAEEHAPGRNQVVVLSHAFWQQRYGGDPDVIGRTLRLDGENVTIIGVMPAHFDYRMLWGRTALWRPLNFTREQLEWRDYRAFEVMGRLRSDAGAARVAAELAPVAMTQEQEYPESYAGLRYQAIPLHEALMDDLGRRLSWMLFGLAAFVLLIACANLANLQLARATSNLRELAIRSALGASRARLVRQQLLESVTLALGGGALGLGLAWVLNRVIDRNLHIAGDGGSLDITLNGKVLLASLLISLATGLLFGIAPAWLASRADMNLALKQQGRGNSAGKGHQRIRQGLIVAEVALALILLSGAAIMHRGFARLMERAAGWDTDRVLTASLPIPETRLDTDEKRTEFFRRLEERLASLPGVEHAALATSLPLFSYTADRQILTEGQSPGNPSLPSAFHVMVTPDYFAALGISLVEGRLFPADIDGTDPRVIVVNESLARRLWPGRSAIGQRLGSMDSGQPYWAEVIGVVRDVDTAASTRDPSTLFQVYKPLVHEPWSYVNIVVRGPAPASLADAVRRAIAEVDPDLAASGVGTVRQIVDLQQHNLVLAGRVLTGFGILGLILAAVGLYGVISNLVALRTTEFGVRLALGAQPRDVLRLVMKQGFQLVLLGVVLGLFGAVALGRFLGSLMPRLGGIDPIAIVLMVFVLLAIAHVACWIPARRATRVDPITALRAE